MRYLIAKAVITQVLTKSPRKALNRNPQKTRLIHINRLLFIKALIYSNLHAIWWSHYLWTTKNGLKLITRKT